MESERKMQFHPRVIQAAAHCHAAVENIVDDLAQALEKI